jgi:hypothetical protein
MGRRDCGVRRNGTLGLWCEKEWDSGTVVCEGMGRRECGVRRNGTLGLWCEKEWDGGTVV